MALALRQLNPIHKKGPQSCFFLSYLIIVLSNSSLKITSCSKSKETCFVAALSCSSKNLLIKPYRKQENVHAEDLFQKKLHGKQSWRPFLNCSVWEIIKAVKNKKVSAMLKIQFFDVHILFSLNQGVNKKLLKNVYILNWGGWLT